LASRASAKSLIRSFEGNYGSQILGALRSLAGVTVNAEAMDKGKKRARDDEGDDAVREAKRRALDTF